ncbi:hypothetical protein EGW08_000983 [Elysia chlorotica]|uniref:FERM domain-containing protein 8 n=1 Tax=Elysia chlorotica TaxID=188477 RepID=A0A433UBR1_ELYCH|nr:hypothetical protein EGW08_000983 [Elysia chlorotica]
MTSLIQNILGNKEENDEEAAESNELLNKVPPVEQVMNVVVFLKDRSGIHFTLEDAPLTNCSSLLHLVIHEQGLPAEAADVFCCWLVSPIIELRLKKHHNPFEVVQRWDELCARYTDASNDEIHDSEPVLMVQRDCFFRKEQEKHIQNEQILCLLYHEAKYNVIEGRYILHEEDYHYLAGIQALIHLGSFDSHQHVIANYRADLIKFYPEHMYSQPRFGFLKRSNSHTTPVEELFMEAHRRASEELAHIASRDNLGQLYRKYLELLWTYPFYGGAFFNGVVEGKTSRLRRFILPNPDIRVKVCINTEGVCLFNQAKADLLLYVPFTQLSWTWQDLPWDGDSDPPPTLMLQFICDEQAENQPGKPVTKLLQVYSREARLMDALIETCVRRKLESLASNADADFVDGGVGDTSERKLLNKLEKLTLETYTQDGEQLESA